jgi:UDP-GlcNAc:undecaprenyl-phosphate GlcNAc-1-phosphate transferase
MLTIAPFCLISALLTAAICRHAEALGRLTRLVDRPDGIRKLHERETPLIGGLALLVPSLGVSAVWLAGFAHAPFMFVAVAAAAVTLIVGVIDDRWGLSPVWRLLALTFVSFTVFSVSPMFVLHAVRIGIFDFSVFFPLGQVAAPVVAFVILGFVNAANMADGMNGQLLGSIAIWSAFIACYLGADAGLPFIAVICSALVTLAYNLRGRLFTGSSGAYAASLLVALGAIAAYRRSDGALPAELPIFWFWLPVLDCVRLMMSRAVAGRSPLAGDRNHFHHMLLEHMRPQAALLVYLGLLAAPGAAALAGWTLGSAVQFVCVGCYATFVVLRQARMLQARAVLPAAVAPVIAGRMPEVVSIARRVVDMPPRPQPAVVLQDAHRRTHETANL